MIKMVFCILLGAVIGTVLCIVVACISLEGTIDHKEEEEENKKSSL